MESKIAVIVAMGENREIGKAGKLLWHIPEDLKRFKEITRGHPIIMGRKTYQSIGKALPGRTNLVISQDPEFKAEGCAIAHSLEEALQQACIEYYQSAQSDNEIFVIGGGQIYQQALSFADKLYLTLVEGNFPEADTFFPDYSEFNKIVYKANQESDGYKYTFLELEKGKI